MADVTAIGEVLIDFTPYGETDQRIPLFACNPGGAPANVLAMVNRLGGETEFIGKVGQDAFGQFLKGKLDACGIQTGGLIFDPSVYTTLAFVHLDEQGNRSFSFCRSPGADTTLTKEEVLLEKIDASPIFHFGSVSLTDEPCRSAVQYAVEYAKKHGKVISYDPNYRPLLWKNEEQAIREMAAMLSFADIVKVSEEEMVLLTTETDLEKGAAALKAHGPALVLVSLGSKGAFYAYKSECGLLPTFDVATIDTTGAGDAFLGAALYCLSNLKRKSIKDIELSELKDILRFANAAGSLTTTKKGAIPAMPTKDEIVDCLQHTPLLC